MNRAPCEPPPPPIPPLRVGVTADSPPFVLVQGGRVVGIEIDLAARLADHLGRPMEIVNLTWDQLIPTLLDGHIDMIASGMTVTKLRQLRVSFADPYLHSGLAVLIRRSDADKFKSPAAVMRGDLRIGVVKGTTGEQYVRENYSGGQIFNYMKNDNAVVDLVQRRVDAFVTDAPIVAWLASEHEGSLVPLLRPLLTKDSIAWAFHPGDEALVATANAELAKWREDGTLNGVIRRWVPLWSDN
jgi:polar amino acid transport system substrate-binding protein